MFGTLVLSIAASKYEHLLAAARERDGEPEATALTVESLVNVASEFKQITPASDGPYEQLHMIIEAIYQHSGMSHVRS